MIDVDEELRLIDLFRQEAEDRRHELRLIANERFDEDRKRRHVLQQRKEEEERKFEEALATSTQIAAFDEHLDQYDTATVQALMDNQHALDLVFKRREEMDASAYRLPDGRMAFKTEDGKRVFDQHGAELGRDSIHPEAIPDSAPTWEAKQRIEADSAKLEREREELHRYQHRLDAARDASGKNNVTAGSLARMEAELQRDMPESIRTQLPSRNPDTERIASYGTPHIVPECTPLTYAPSVPASP